MPTFNFDNPLDTVKIRNLPSNIRNNFQSQKNGGSSFVMGRANLFTSSTPSTQASMIRLYGKSDGSNVELNVKDEQGNAYQITENGKLGSQGTQQLTSGISFDDSYFYTASNFVAARAHIGSTAAVTMADGISSATNPSTGKYTVVVDSGRLQVDDYEVHVQCRSVSESALYVAVVAVKPTVNPATTTTIEVYVWNAVAGALADKRFDIIVVGGR